MMSDGGKKAVVRLLPETCTVAGDTRDHEGSSLLKTVLVSATTAVAVPAAAPLKGEFGERP
jgi:hypothetical protein